MSTQTEPDQVDVVPVGAGLADEPHEEVSKMAADVGDAIGCAVVGATGQAAPVYHDHVAVLDVEECFE